MVPVLVACGFFLFGWPPWRQVSSSWTQPLQYRGDEEGHRCIAGRRVIEVAVLLES